MAKNTIIEILQKKVNNAKGGRKQHKIPDYIKKYQGDNKRLKSFPARRMKA